MCVFLQHILAKILLYIIKKKLFKNEFESVEVNEGVVVLKMNL